MSLKNCYLVFFISFFLLSGCEKTEKNAITKETAIINDKNKAFDEKNYLQPLLTSQVKAAAVVDIDGEMASLYPSENKLIFKKAGEETVVTDKQVPETGVWLHNNSRNLYALWWNKTAEGKKLRIKSSQDKGKTFSENEAFIAQRGIVPLITIADNGTDKIAVAYQSERQPGYQVYFNRSLDAGKTWLENDVRINELYDDKGPVKVDAPLLDIPGGSHTSDPYLSYIDGKLIIVWQEISIFGAKKYLRIVSKSSSDDGLTWSDETEILRHPDLNSQEMHVNKLGNELFVSVFIPNEGLLIFSTINKGINWQQLNTVGDTKISKGVSYMRSAAVPGEKRFISFVSTATNGKDRINIFENRFDSKEWVNITETSTGVRSKETVLGDNFETKSTLPVISVFKNSMVVIAWEDYQNILPSVMFNYSLDKGKTWQKNPLFLASPGKVVTKFPGFIEGKDKLHLTYTYHDAFDSARKITTYYSTIARLEKENSIDVNVRPQEALFLNVSEEEKLTKLKKRSEEFWSLRVKENYAETYIFFDPLYRSMFPLETFLKTQGKIRFLEAKSGNVVKHGNIAIVDTDITISVTAFENMGLGIEASTPQKKEMKARWGWFYDDWYLMPETLFDRRFKY